MEKEYQCRRFRQPIHLTLSEDAVKMLKDTGNNASKVIDRLVLDAFTESRPIRVLIGQKGWARRDSNTRSSPCEGDVIAN